MLRPFLIFSSAPRKLGQGHHTQLSSHTQAHSDDCRYRLHFDLHVYFLEKQCSSTAPSPLAVKVSEHLVYHGKTKYRSMCLPCIF